MLTSLDFIIVSTSTPEKPSWGSYCYCYCPFPSFIINQLLFCVNISKCFYYFLLIPWENQAGHPNQNCWSAWLISPFSQQPSGPNKSGLQSLPKFDT